MQRSQTTGRSAKSGAQAGSVTMRPARVRHVGGIARLLVGAVALVAPLIAAESAPGDTSRVSVGPAGAQGDGPSYVASISADGRYVAFESLAANLVAGDTNEVGDVFVHDRQTGTTERVSVNSEGAEGNNLSYYPSISADGRYVAFDSVATNLISGGTYGVADVYVHDRQTGATERVSVSSDGTEGNDASSYAAISADGRYVVFESLASNLVDGDTNGSRDVFVHDRQTGATTRVSVSAAGEQGDDYSSDASISADGRYVVFESLASNLVAGDTSGSWDVFVHDRQTGATERVSVSSAGEPGNSSSDDPSISADGRYVAFKSLASNLVVGSASGSWGVFVHDRQTGATERVSVSSAGEPGDDGSYLPSISADGRYVAFESLASNLVDGDASSYNDVFVHDRQTGTTERVSVSSAGQPGDNHSAVASISADGKYVAFHSGATNLVAPDTNGVDDVFVHERGLRPPTVQATVAGSQGSQDWYTSDVEISWSIDTHRLAVGDQTGCDPTSVTTDTAGQTFTCSVTTAGGTTTESVTIKRDATLPVATATPAPLPNANGWHQGRVTVQFTGTDATSGIASCAPEQVLSSEGAGQSASGTCTDQAGNVSALATIADVNIDATAPVVSATVTPSPNASLWNNTLVSVAFTATDAASGVAADGCDPPVQLANDGAAQSATGSCRDRAGNAGVATVSGINIDRTPPVAAATAAPGPNANGWNNTDVRVSFEGADSLSGSGVAACSPPVVLQAEGAGLSAAGNCTDVAGNVGAAATASGINIDKTAPAIAIAAPPNGASFVEGTTVTASYQCTDARSGVASCTGPVANGSSIDTSGTGARTFAVSAADLAGNPAVASHAYTVTATTDDATPPVIEPDVKGALGDNGWYRSNVKIAWHVADPDSTITAQSGCETTRVRTDTSGVTLTCSATSAGGTATRSITIKRDTKAPSVVILSPVDFIKYPRNSRIPAFYTCLDFGSGNAACVGTVPSGSALDTSKPGDKRFVVKARDEAGNKRTATVDYRVR